MTNRNYEQFFVDISSKTPLSDILDISVLLDSYEETDEIRNDITEEDILKILLCFHLYGDYKSPNEIFIKYFNHNIVQRYIEDIITDEKYAKLNSEYNGS